MSSQARNGAQLVHSPDMGCIAPEYLQNITNTTYHHHTTSKPKLPANMQAICHLAPGRTHKITEVHMPTPRGLIDGSFHGSLTSAHHEDTIDAFTILPRVPEHCGTSGAASIVFCVNGRPGPYLHKLERVVLDSPDVAVFDGFGWRRTTLVLDWPGVRTEKHYLSCTPDSSFHTRQQVAREVARQIVSLISYSRKSIRSRKFSEQPAIDPRWDIRTVDIRDVRLLGLNYYNNAWVPVLAVDD